MTKETNSLTGERIDGFVSLETGEIDRSIFFESAVFEHEMETIFGRAWLFLCHATQIPERGDFFESVMGRDNVLVVRQKDGSIKALLNTCAHRGNAVCRAEEGNARSFLCSYHGWSYGIDGRLKGVPGHKNFYKGDLDKSKHGLREVAQVADYKGFIFATHDPTAPSLDDFLGATGRLSLDLLAMKGDMEIVPGIQKFTIDCNWKIAVDNLFDWYHPQVTHASAFAPSVLGSMLGGGGQNGAEEIDMTDLQMQDGADLDIPLGLISGTNFEQSVVLGEYGHAIGGPTATSSGNADMISGPWRDTPEAKEALGPAGAGVAGHPNLFPTLWVVQEMSQLSLRIPRTPDSTEIWWFTFADRNLDPGMRQFSVNLVSHIFGPAGLLEQDDGENWSQATHQSCGFASRNIPHLLNMGLGHGEIIDEGGLKRIEGFTSEHAQLYTYHAWAQWMKDLDWDELKEATTPGDTI